jgi:leader peptidase (prepilin peptidase)/N-methyltransferase
MAVLLSQGWPLLILIAWVSLAVGSFLNVVIHRLPIMLEREWRSHARELLELPAEAGEPPGTYNLFVPRSGCPSCDAPIRAWQNIPIVSWLALRGRCAACGARISVRYPLVELGTAMASLAVLAVFGYTWFGAAAVLATWMLIAMAAIDLDTKLLPDNLTLPLLWLGLLVNLGGGGLTDIGSAIIGAVAGYLVLWSVYWLFKLLTKKEGMGYGDFKLLAALGAWLGWQALPMIILLSSVVGVILGGAYLVVKKSREPIPFGPFLAAAGWIALLGRDSLIGLFGA